MVAEGGLRTPGLSSIAKAFLFLSSYLPLWVILGLFHYESRDIVFWAAVGAAIAGFVGLLILWSWIRSTAPSSVTVDESLRQDGDSVAYIVTYIIPFLSLTVTDAFQAVGVFLLFFVILVVYVSSDMLYVNPILAAGGWRAYAIHTKAGVEVMVLSRRRIIRAGVSLSLAEITDSIWWERSAVA